MNKTTISSTFAVCGTRNAVITEHFSHQYVPTLHQYTNYSYKFHVTWLKESKRDPVVNLRLLFLTIEEKKGFICNRDSQVKQSILYLRLREFMTKIYFPSTICFDGLFINQDCTSKVFVFIFKKYY